MAVGDLNRDGNPDLVTANSLPSFNVSVLLGDGSGGFGPAVNASAATIAEPAKTLAAVARLLHHSTIREMNVESYRRRAAQSGGAPAAGKTR